MKWSSRWSPIPWLAAAAAIIALACGSEPEPGGAGAPMPAQAKATTALPENFPDDVPSFPGARIEKVRFSPDEGLSVSYTTDEDVDAVVDYFADSFAAEGWSAEVRDMSQGRAVFADKDRRTASVVSTRSDEGTQIELVLFEMQ